jgi:hypothetical protein
MYLHRDGNLGIGTAAPEYALDVSGYINANQGLKLKVN